jgi:hypothetical protein
MGNRIPRHPIQEHPGRGGDKQGRHPISESRQEAATLHKLKQEITSNEVKSLFDIKLEENGWRVCAMHPPSKIANGEEVVVHM